MTKFTDWMFGSGSEPVELDPELERVVKRRIVVRSTGSKVAIVLVVIVAVMVIAAIATTS